MIQIENLTHKFGKTVALSEINLTLPDSGIVAVLGPNGAGKTTLISILAGLLPYRTGRVALDGLDRKRNDDAARAIVAYVPDAPHLLPMATGREFLEFVCDCYRVPKETAGARIAHLARAFDMEAMLDETPGKYSRGQAKRVSLCAAMVSGAKIYLMDEPFSGGLDPNGQAALKIGMRSLRDSGALVLFATQIPEMAEELADVIIILHEGRVYDTGTLAQLEQRQGTAGEGLLPIFSRLSGRSLSEVAALFAEVAKK